MSDAEESASKKILARVMKGEGPCVKANGVAVSRQIADALGLKIGSPVLITGSRTTVAVVESIENIRDPVIYLGRMTRMNSEAHWNEYVEVSNVVSKERAERVVVGPSEEGQALDIEADALKGLLIGTYVTAGDTIEVGVRGFHNILRARSDSRFIRLCVIETVPKIVLRRVPCG